ncbi:histidinol-phosphate transaminase [Marinobacteraceae bacterium S3BR75-40.1]
MSRFWSPFVNELQPYVPGEQPKGQSLIKLNTNENPYGPSPKVIRAIQEATDDGLRLYPDPNSQQLKDVIAAHHGVESNQVFVGNGSDEVLAHVFLGFFKQDRPIAFPDITYSFYPVYCGLYGIEYETVALNGQFQIDVSAFPDENGGIIFANPNAPTGLVLGPDELEKLLARQTASVVVVDEAYVDFGAESAISLVDRYPNLLVVQTVSKSRSLAGLRVGWAVGHRDLIAGLERVKNSFNSYPLDRLAIAGAVAAFEDEAYFQDTRARVMESREQMSRALRELGFEVLPSQANFVFVSHPEHPAAQLGKALREDGIIVRYFNKPRIDRFLRITVGTPEENEALIRSLKAILGNL